VVPRLVDHLDEEDCWLVPERDAGVRIDVREQLLDVVRLRRNRRVAPAQLSPSVVSGEAWHHRVAALQRVGPARVISLDRAQEHIDAALARFRDQVVGEVEVRVREKIARLVGVLPIAPESDTKSGPTHPCEMGEVLVDELLPIER
jgi:hypothetical protein